MDLNLAIKWSCLLHTEINISFTWKRRHYIIWAKLDDWDTFPVGIYVQNVSKAELDDRTHVTIKVDHFDPENLQNSLSDIIKGLDFNMMAHRFTSRHVRLPYRSDFNIHQERQYYESNLNTAVKSRVLINRFRYELFGFIKVINKQLDKHTFLAYQPIMFGYDGEEVTIFKQNEASTPLFSAALVKKDFLELHVDFDWYQTPDKLSGMCQRFSRVCSNEFREKIVDFIDEEWATRLFIEQTYMETHRCLQNITRE